MFSVWLQRQERSNALVERIKLAGAGHVVLVGRTILHAPAAVDATDAALTWRTLTTIDNKVIL